MRSRSIVSDGNDMSSGSVRRVLATATESAGDAVSPPSANAAMRANEDLDDINPPAYESLSTELELHELDSDAQASLTEDGRVSININQEPRWNSDDMSPTLQGADALTGPSEERYSSLIPYRTLTADNGSSPISQALYPRIMEAGDGIEAQVRAEEGTETGAQHLHARLNTDDRRCTLVPDRVAVWRVKHKDVQLCALAATTLTHEGMLDLNDLESFQPQEYDTESGPWNPISALASATFDTVGSVLTGVAEGPLEAYRQMKPSGKGSQEDVKTLRSNALHQAPYLAQSTTERSSNSQSIEADLPSSRSSQNPCGQVALSTGRGVARIIGAGLKSPVTFTHRLAQGFHNAPKLYGDTTVRKTDKITGVKSGLAAAGKGFGYGLYDGLTGLAIQPIQGAQREGTAGLLKGFGKGLGGMVFKPAAGACGIPGYAFMGLYKQLPKISKAKVSGRVAADRIVQGEEDYHRSTKQERLDIVSRWYTAEPHQEFE